MGKIDEKTIGGFKEIPIPLMLEKKESYKHKQMVSLPRFAFRPISNNSKLLKALINKN